MLSLVLSPTDIRVTEEHFDSLKVEINHWLWSRTQAVAYDQTKHAFTLLTEPLVYDWDEQMEELEKVTERCMKMSFVIC